MRLVFMGSSEFAVPSLKALGEAGHGIAAVVTRPDRPRRRRFDPPGPTPVGAFAESIGLPVLRPTSARDPAFAGSLGELAPECVIVAAYGQILPREILAIPPRWCINLHASLLPRWRGAAPIARALLAGDRVTGVTTMRMDEGLDTGDILLQAECAIGLDETAGRLERRLADLGARLLVDTMERHAAGRLEPRRQDARDATEAPKLTRADGVIDWSEPAERIANRVRACNPWPLAATQLRGETVRVLRAEASFEKVQPRGSGASPGRILRVDGERGLVLCGGATCLAILELQWPGRRPTTARDAINGRLIRAGDHLGPAPIG
ncbi:MAG: methionyl-tRNA formyltransferase [Candidatus Polarisedimenticolia bacterium]